MSSLLPILRRHGLLRPYDRDMFSTLFEDFGLPTVFTEEREFMPAFDVSETENELIITAEVPGMDKKDLDIHLSEGVLTVKGEKKQETEEKKENYHCVERRYGAFSRTMRLPVDVDTDKVDAAYKDGVLKITLPKSETAKPRKIEVKN